MLQSTVEGEGQECVSESQKGFTCLKDRDFKEVNAPFWK